MNGSNLSTKGARLGRKADDSDLFDHAVRVGLVSYGIVHLLIAWLALQLALGSSAGSASSKGALSEVAQKPLGQISLYVVAAGFLALVLWQLTEAAVGHRKEDGAAVVGLPCHCACAGRAVPCLRPWSDREAEGSHPHQEPVILLRLSGLTDGGTARR